MKDFYLRSQPCQTTKPFITQPSLEVLTVISNDWIPLIILLMSCIDIVGTSFNIFSYDVFWHQYSPTKLSGCATCYTTDAGYKDGMQMPVFKLLMLQGRNTCKNVAESRSVQWNDAPKETKKERNKEENVHK